MSVLIVTGTGTDVGKTVVTAALAACAPGSVAVVKPAQTGVLPDQPGDLAEVTRLTGIADTFEFVRYPDPLSPEAAARHSNRPFLDWDDAVERIEDLAKQYDTVLVEGAGGVLVPFDSDGRTILDLANELDAAVVVVTAPGLGTINHTALTLRVVEEEVGDPAGLIIGSWPASPGLAELHNVRDLRRMAHKRRLAGALPEGCAALPDFPEIARASLAPEFGGTFDPDAFADAARQELASVDS